MQHNKLEHSEWEMKSCFFGIDQAVRLSYRKVSSSGQKPHGDMSEKGKASEYKVER
jgi:hypothetical protein